MSLQIGNVEVLQETFSDIWVDDAVYPALLPVTTEDVMRAVTWCRENGWRILPVGQGHSFTEKHSPGSGVLTLLSIGRDGISEADPRDLAIEVESGVPASAVFDTAYQSGMKLDGWPADYKGTVGGLVCGGKGSSIRHLILGVDLVDGRGRSLRFGGRIRKNVSGFDVATAFAGSNGFLGWLDRVYLRLQPMGSPDLDRAYLQSDSFGSNLDDLLMQVAKALDPDGVFLKRSE